MNMLRYKHPPLVKTYLGHAGGTAVLGYLLPAGEHLGWLHTWMLPIIQLIPNAVLITNRAPDPVFAQTFIGLSFLFALIILVFYVVAMRGYHTKTFETARKRWTVLLYMWAAVIFGLTALWYMPYLDPLSHGRAYFLLLLAMSEKFGTVTVMNQLVVGMPLLLLLLIWLGHSCTTVRNRISYI